MGRWTGPPRRDVVAPTAVHTTYSPPTVRDDDRGGDRDDDDDGDIGDGDDNKDSDGGGDDDRGDRGDGDDGDSRDGSEGIRGGSEGREKGEMSGIGIGVV